MARKLTCSNIHSSGSAAPKKINFELLAEQERQLAAEQDRMPSAGWRTRAGSGSQAGVSPVPPSVDPDEEYDSPEELKRSLSGRSLRSNGNSSTRRLRGLRFTTCSTREDPNLPQPSSPQLSFRKDLFSKSLGSQSDYAIESESEGGESARLHSLSRSSSLGNTCQPRRKYVIPAAFLANRLCADLTDRLRFGFGSAGEQRGPAVLA